MTRSTRCGTLLGLLLVATQACNTNDVADPATPDGDSPAAVTQGDVRVDLTLDQIAFAADEPVLANVTITNTGAHKLKLLSWFLPGADLEESTFVVTHGASRSDFVGPHYKRPRPETGDFIHLAAGASITTQVDLARFYDFSTGGDYGIRFEVNVRDVRPDDGLTAGRLVSNTANVWVEARAIAAPEPITIDATAGGVSFSRCTTEQQAQVLEAVNVAGSMSADAVSYLYGTPTASERYATWFGAYSAGGWSTAQQHFVSIADAFATKPITVDCKCKKRYYAYVYPSQPYNIYVCKVFWSAPMSGTDSKGGTLVHEMSHFDVVAGTNDWAYGQSACKSLAASDPARALDNADSHEYFAENTPALP